MTFFFFLMITLEFRATREKRELILTRFGSWRILLHATGGCTRNCKLIGFRKALIFFFLKRKQAIVPANDTERAEENPNPYIRVCILFWEGKRINRGRNWFLYGVLFPFAYSLFLESKAYANMGYFRVFEVLRSSSDWRI